MGIMAATLVTSLKFDIKRDREEEMIHRGVQYSRAIRAYYKKFGRYPATIENLENTNQMRFLRKRYKDPITGKDFKLLHFGEAKMGLTVGGGIIPGASTIGPKVDCRQPLELQLWKFEFVRPKRAGGSKKRVRFRAE
jgi:type II secretory pathway pseudopilin PulG